MVDPLSISASIAAILQLTSTVVLYLQDVKDASEDRQRILTEVTSATGLLYCLKDLADREQESSPSASAVRLLAIENGPLSQFKRALEQLSSKLAPVTGLKKAGKALTWPFQKREISDVLSIIERQKTYFMLALQNKHLELSKAIKDDVAHLRSGIDSLGRQMGEMKLDALSEKVMQWLKPVDPSTNHNVARKKHQPTTGAWLLGQQSYQDWKTSNGGLLWMNGKVGCGKTILCSTAIEDILAYCRTRTEHSACYYYFDFQDDEKTRHETLMRTILHHMALQSPECLNLLNSLFQSCQDGSQQPSHSKLLEILKAILEKRPSTYIVIDALDECVDREDLLSLIKKIVDWTGVHILATSRKERDIEEALSVCATHQVDFRNDDVDTDIRSHVRRQVQDDPKLAAWPLEIQQEIVQTLGSRANGMFRWAVCQLDAVRKCVKLGTLRKTLGNLPNTLDDTYHRILCSIDEEYMDDALKILQWLTFSARPMLLDEIAEVAAIDLTQDPKFDGARRLRRPQDVVSICSSLVVVSSEQIQADDVDSQTIALAHLSVKDYLTSTRIVSTRAAHFQISELSAHRCLAEMCLSYLAENGPKVPNLPLVDYPLSRYAAEFWTQHATAADDESLYALITNMFTSSAGFLLCWVRLDDPDMPPWEWYERSGSDFSRSEASIGSPLYYASCCGLLGTVERLLASGADVNGKGANFPNALIAASSQGHDKIVLKLIQNGATKNAGVHPDNTAVVTALRAGHTSTVHLLLLHSHVLTKDQLNHCLLEAAGIGANETALLLLQRGADSNFVDSGSRTPLSQAAYWGNESMVQLLLDHGADVNAGRNNAWTALSEAASSGYTKIISILLAHGADVNSLDLHTYETALIAASFSGRIEVVQLLLDHSADINAVGGIYRTALIAASFRGRTEVVQLLLDYSADINAVGGIYGTALIAASFRGRTEVVQLLLDYGADINAVGGRNGTALTVASEEGCTEVVQLLLDHSADINAVGGIYGTALIAASFRGRIEVVQLLLDYGADINAVGGIYGTALIAASFRGCIEVVQLLLDYSADINAVGGRNGTALTIASEQECTEVVQLLLDHSADINAVGGILGTALAAAAYWGHTKIVTKLLAHGADTTYSNPTLGGTALEAARRRRHNEIVHILEDHETQSRS